MRRSTQVGLIGARGGGRSEIRSRAGRNGGVRSGRGRRWRRRRGAAGWRQVVAGEFESVHCYRPCWKLVTRRYSAAAAQSRAAASGLSWEQRSRRRSKPKNVPELCSWHEIIVPAAMAHHFPPVPTGSHFKFIAKLPPLWVRIPTKSARKSVASTGDPLVSGRSPGACPSLLWPGTC